MELKSIYFLIPLLLLAFLTNATSQDKPAIKQVLQTAFTHNSVKFQSEKFTQLYQLDYEIPFVEKIEIRSETNDFDLSQQDLAIRVSPNSGATRKAHKLYHESVQHMTKMEYEVEIVNALLERYYLINEFVFAQEMLQIEQIKDKVARDKVTLLKRMVSLETFDIVELIEAEDEVYNLQRKIQDIKNRIENLKTQLGHLLADEEIKIKRKDIISIDQIKKRFALQKTELIQIAPEVEVLSARHYNSLMEYEWVAAKNKFSIGFVQAKYGYNPGNPFKSNFSIGFGFNFPMKGSSSIDLNEIKLDILNTKSQYIALQDQLKQNQRESASKLKSLLQMYDLLSIQMAEGNVDHALIEYSKQGVASPRAIMKLKELSVNNQALLIEIEADIMSTYLEFIYSTGQIGIKPYKNYLDEELELIQ